METVTQRTICWKVKMLPRAYQKGGQFLAPVTPVTSHVLRCANVCQGGLLDPPKPPSICQLRHGRARRSSNAEAMEVAAEAPVVSLPEHPPEPVFLQAVYRKRDACFMRHMLVPLHPSPNRLPFNSL